MYNNEKCCCISNLENNVNLKLTFENEVYSVYGNLNAGEKIILKYHGNLISNQDDNRKIFLNYGYGNLWTNKNVIEMDACCHSEDKCYCCELEIINNENLFFCFMDDSNNWDLDNNSSYMIMVNESATILTKKNVDIAIQEDEYQSTTIKLFNKIKEKIINFLLKIGETLEGTIKA